MFLISTDGSKSKITNIDMKKLNYKNYFNNKMNSFREEGFDRKFTPILRELESFPFSRVQYGRSQDLNHSHTSDNELKIWCTNDYLNMSHNKEVIEEMISVIRKVGSGSGGTRNISGTTPYHQGLEVALAKFHGRESALIFNSAYLANQTVIWTICKALKDVVVFSDSLNHASLIQGIKNSNSDCEIFEHNNIKHLEDLLKKQDMSRPKLIVFESLYSMDGTIAPVDKYVQLAKEYNALTYLDEVHAVGLYGNKGRGIADYYGVSNEVDVINGTLAKSFGQIGGYVVADSYLTEYVKSFAPGFIFTTSIMPSVAAAATKSISLVQEDDMKRSYIKEHANYLREMLDIYKIPFIDSDSHIVPVMAYESSLAKKYSKDLHEQFNIYVQPIFYPTVAKGQARLRITVTPKHTKEDINELVNALAVITEKKTASNKYISNSKNISLSSPFI